MWVIDLLQVIVALIVMIILAVVAFAIYNAELKTFLENMVKTTNIKRKTVVFDGIFPINNSTHITYNTYDPNDGTFLDLSPSINQAGGAEYTYNFWVYIPSSADTSMANRSAVLFVRGSDIRMGYKTDWNCEVTDLVNNADAKWFLVKNPLVKLVYNEQGAITGIITEFNSVTSPDAFHANATPVSCDNKTKHDNMLGIHGLESSGSSVVDKWNMVTIVVQESNPSSDIMFRNKAIIKMYLNGYQYLDKNAEIDYSGDDRSTSMRNNQGNLFVNPKRDPNARYPTQNIGIANLYYYNYALSSSEIVSLFNAGFTKTSASIPSTFNNSMANYEVASLNTEKIRNVIPY